MPEPRQNMGLTPERAEALVVNVDENPTLTTDMQSETELDCLQYYMDVIALKNLEEIGAIGTDGSGHRQSFLLREKTVNYLRRGLQNPLGPSYTSLDASRPWLVYWMLHALELLNAFPTDLVPGIRATLKSCMVEGGKGFGGGFMQEGHTAPTYASILAICTLGDLESFQMVDRQAIYDFLMELKDESGGFRVQKDGELDTRGLYTALAVASVLNILTPELTKGCAEFVGRCQTFDGGMGGEPGNEAHGGYAFCALAALCILDRFDTIDVDALVDWVVHRQMRLEGGYQGRTNKLVDACYSFWQGAIPVLLHKHLGIRLPATATEMEQAEQALNSNGAPNDVDAGSYLFAQTRLQQYLLLCCQFFDGGLKDKPEKHRDQYHTCYALSGLSLAQEGGSVLWGDPQNLLKATDPVYNVQADKLQAARDYFAAQPPVAPQKV